MERFVTEKNIERFRALLETESDQQQRVTILSLLAREEQRLAELQRRPKYKSIGF
jgi:hypothetical protein